MLRRLVVVVGANKTILRCTKLQNHKLPVQNLQVSRHMSGYFDSRTPDEPEKYTGVEKSYEEWKFVEDLFPNATVPPAPQDLQTVYPSGWKPPNPNNSALPFHIRRTKNHMVPVYFKMDYRGNKPHTKIRYVEGNIWALEKQIGQFLKKKYPTKPIVTITDEVQRCVKVKGDYEEDVKKWILDQGF